MFTLVAVFPKVWPPTGAVVLKPEICAVAVTVARIRAALIHPCTAIGDVFAGCAVADVIAGYDDYIERADVLHAACELCRIRYKS